VSKIAQTARDRSAYDRRCLCYPGPEPSGASETYHFQKLSLIAPEKTKLPKNKILIVEDEPAIRDLCAKILESHGFKAIIAGDGVEGLGVYQERHEEICLVLSDVTMPLMGGIELTRKLFEMDGHPNVILMSGYSLSDIVPDEVRRLCSVINKPFSASRLVEAVRKCLKYDSEHHPSATGGGVQ
jgi:DNA-binding NtrC family response regulator